MLVFFQNSFCNLQIARCSKILIVAATFPSSALAQWAPQEHQTLFRNWQPSSVYRGLDRSFQTDRVIHDHDGDGFCDLWVSLFDLSHTRLQQNGDADGDGLSGYKEMRLCRDPTVATPLPRVPTAAELYQAARLGLSEGAKDRIGTLRGLDSRGHPI